MKKLFRYVKLKYHPICSSDEIVAGLITETQNLDSNDFVELLIFNENEGVLMTGKMTDGDKYNAVNIIL